MVKKLIILSKLLLLLILQIFSFDVDNAKIKLYNKNNMKE